MTVNFKLHSALPPAAIMGALTDFGPGRAEAWPNIDSAHFKVHGQGPGWAEVTEGSSVAGGVWERERYSWDLTKGAVLVETLDSNTWGPGSRWDYRLTPASDGGTTVDVTVVRNPKSLKGRLIAIGLSLVGAGMLRSQMKQVLDRISPAAESH